ncbi:hypothetical protein SAMN03097699_3234 [Flavobacteriaceae bacterium MAR_2010_188]|nr:hypothetical protein SAMN03097699_3234 [Flavobacteriaceae bacterium MAR_2010_188]
MYDKTFPNKRYKLTLEFMNQHISKNSKILDLGVKNPFSKILQEDGYAVKNTDGEDLDENIENLVASDADVTTAFEIFEHLLSPYHVLKNIKSDKLVASVPLRLWFSKAYQDKNDPRDRHYHEFEDWQFDWLLEKTGWIIKDSNKWTNPVKKLGIRPLLRFFTNRYYIVYAVRKK